MQDMYDIIFIGSGVAGSYLVSKLPELNVLIIEKDKKVPIKDSGIVSSRFKNFFHKNFIKQKINEIKLVSPSSYIHLHSEKPFAYILERRKFSAHLRKQAREKTTLKYEKAIDISHSKDLVAVETEENIYTCKLLIGADGANSLVRKSLGIKDPALFPGILARTRKKIDIDTISVYFNKYYSPEFFSWVIPQNNEYGLITRIRPIENLLYFQKSLNLPEADINSALIPIGLTKSYSSHVLLIGDACSQVKPLTGGGIIFSLIAADHALPVIEKAFEKNNFGKRMLYEYEKSWHADLAWEIRKQLFIRKLYRKFSNKDIDQAFSDFGPALEKMQFDYDYFTAAKFPKLKLLKFFIKNLPLLL